MSPTRTSESAGLRGLDDAGLVYEVRHDPGAPAGVVLVLPGRDLDEDFVVAMVARHHRRRTSVIAEPPRRLYKGREVVGRRWYIDNLDGSIDPATFADAARSVEVLIDRIAQVCPPLIVGEGQGGELALALVLLMPERLAGAVAVHAGVPEVAGWRRPTRRADGLGIRLVDPPPRARQRTETELRRAGARVSFDTWTSGPGRNEV